MSKARNAISKTASAPLWAGQSMRLDPLHLPIHFGYRSDMGNARVTITEKGVVMRRDLPCGLPISIGLPLAAFEGVAARVQEDDGEISVTLELLHQDIEMCVPLLVSDGLEAAADDWHAWCATTGLDMLLIDIDGVVKPVDTLKAEITTGEITTGEPKERRRSMTLRRRRPRIFFKRDTKGAKMRMRIDAREVISSPY